MPGLPPPRIRPALKAEQHISNSLQRTGRLSYFLYGTACPYTHRLKTIFLASPDFLFIVKFFLSLALKCSARDLALKNKKNALSVLEQISDSLRTRESIEVRA